MGAKKYLIIGSIVLCLTGCGGATRWYLNGHSQTQFQMDDARCQSVASGGYQAQGAYYAGQGAGSGDALLAGFGALLSVFEVGGMKAAYGNCMAQLGYTVAP